MATFDPLSANRCQQKCKNFNFFNLKNAEMHIISPGIYFFQKSII